jgi:redox-sensitive bicupin YhaK (pirin superfamily)
MLTLRRSADRGYADHGWLKSHHSFSFADYHDPAHMGVGNLRVLNDDRIRPGTGFATHGHKDMEIVSYVLEGALAHADSLGHGVSSDAASGVILPGDVQRMSAGTGVRHSEFNHSKVHETHFLQVWILPDEQGVEPGYEQVHVDAERKRGRLALIASPDGADGSVSMHADARIFAGLFDGAESAKRVLDPRRPYYVHVARGRISVNGLNLEAGDALTMTDVGSLELRAATGAEVLVFELRAPA